MLAKRSLIRKSVSILPRNRIRKENTHKARTIIGHPSWRRKHLKQKIKAPQLPSSLTTATILQLEEGDDQIGSIQLIGDETNGLICPDHLEIRQSSFKQVTLLNSSFSRSDLSDVVFEKCDLSNVQFQDAIIHKAEFRRCRMTGFNGSGASFRHVRFIDCLLDYSAFGFSNMKNVAFSHCSLQEADFYQSVLKHTEIQDCQLHGANFAQTDLSDMDLRTCSFQQLTVSFDKLQGCTVTSEQAIGFAKILGLNIEDH
ncbi:pentapeptide repeat-containing protein [Halalkalibacterium halodurans]|nr:pentapeptide repeat-containing protein [Halalkalibacterium halodurans]